MYYGLISIHLKNLIIVNKILLWNFRWRKTESSEGGGCGLTGLRVRHNQI